jgi:hypothetical protein
MMELWHTASNKVPATKEQEEWLHKMKDFASKNNLTRTHDHAWLEIPVAKFERKEIKSDFDYLQGPRFVISQKSHWDKPRVEPMGDVQYPEWKGSEGEFVCLSAVMTSPDHDPDALISGTLHFDTTTEWGLDIHPKVTLRFDVKGLQTLLAIPSAYRQPQSGDNDNWPLPLDVYKQNLVLAFGAEDITLEKDKLEGKEFDFSMDKAINYTSIVNGEFGLIMQYVPADCSIWEQIASFAIQTIAIFADFIPVIRPFLSVAIYIGGNCILDATWGENWDNSALAVIASLVSSRANLGKWTVFTANKLNKLRIGA